MPLTNASGRALPRLLRDRCRDVGAGLLRLRLDRVADGRARLLGGVLLGATPARGQAARQIATSAPVAARIQDRRRRGRRGGGSSSWRQSTDDPDPSRPPQVAGRTTTTATGTVARPQGEKHPIGRLRRTVRLRYFALVTARGRPRPVDHSHPHATAGRGTGKGDQHVSSSFHRAGQDRDPADAGDHQRWLHRPDQPAGLARAARCPTPTCGTARSPRSSGARAGPRPAPRWRRPSRSSRSCAAS